MLLCAKVKHSLISQLCLGILPLRIETGHYTNLPVKERTRWVCNSDEVENEHHFLFECNYYAIERSKLESDTDCIFRNMGSNNRFKTVFESPFKLAKYVKLYRIIV